MIAAGILAAFVVVLAWLWRDLQRLSRHRRDYEFRQEWQRRYGPSERPRTR